MNHAKLAQPSADILWTLDLLSPRNLLPLPSGQLRETKAGAKVHIAEREASARQMVLVVSSITQLACTTSQSFVGSATRRVTTRLVNNLIC